MTDLGSSESPGNSLKSEPIPNHWIISDVTIVIKTDKLMGAQISVDRHGYEDQNGAS